MLTVFFVGGDFKSYNFSKERLRGPTFSSSDLIPQSRNLLIEARECLGHWGGFELLDDDLSSGMADFMTPDGYFLIAYVDNIPAGCVGARLVDSDVCELKYLYVRQGLRGRGAGRDLCQFAIDHAEQEGFHWMQAWLHKNSLHARELLTDLGFQGVREESEASLFERAITPKEPRGIIVGELSIKHRPFSR